MHMNSLVNSLATLKEYVFPEIKKMKPQNLFVFFILGFSIIYSLIPSLAYQSILPDSAQNLSWGHTWAWSYNRHPPLGTWFITFMSMICANNEVATFSASILCLSISLVFIFLLSKRYLGSKDAFVACVISSFSLYYQTNFVLQFNQNSIMLPFWVLLCYFFDRCIHSNSMRDWFCLAMATAAAVLAKYESLLIIFITLIYLLGHLNRKYLYRLILATLLTLLLLTPHLISVAQHGYLTLEFIRSKVSGNMGYYVFNRHVYYPIKALIEQLAHLLPAIALLLLLIKTKKVHLAPYKQTCNKWNYLTYLGVAPLGLVILLSFVFGFKIQPEWGFPLFSFSIPALFSFFNLKSRPTLLKPLLLTALLIHGSSLGIYMATNYFSLKLTRTNNPSYLLAQLAQDYWRQWTKEPLLYVAGDENYDYYLAAYLPNKPMLLEGYSFRLSPWLDKNDIKKQGMLIVMQGCDPMRNKQLAVRYAAQDSKCIAIPLSNKYQPQSIKLTLMRVPPELTGRE
ncbi:glycosyltransferase family 39 protein [Legionella worsleiensis]|uniref:Glycosyl transferase n=1 Tax=Legionella worsleiensis TaxID=45076 RepID=A0A0W1AJK8_9GAMM|nr:glycosyltransferase family 39 protein [Legionella worsleiensis]KTD81549.1 glycosyl transferase [Legionella worsleiensis]STY32108.1 glycosyl transferase [Legionella worsleiensis]